MNNPNQFNYSLLDKEQVRAIGEELFKNLKKGMTLQDATGVSDETLEEIYTLAYGYYNRGKYKESVSLFQFLAGASPSNYKYVYGLASSYHQLEVYDEAAAGFYLALYLEPNNPLPAYYTTDCFLKQEFIEEASEFAEVTIRICDNRPEYKELKERCELIKANLNTNLNYKK